MAILTARGCDEQALPACAPQQKQQLARGLGTALCDGGSEEWPPPRETPRAAYSEQRLARLLAAKGGMRADLMERAARMLAARKPADTGIDCATSPTFSCSTTLSMSAK